MKAAKIILMAMTAVSLQSCYDDYINDYDVHGVGFANQTDVRTFVVGEGMTFSTGVALGGVIKNEKDRVVEYSLDASLVNESTLQEMKSHKFSYIQELFKNIDNINTLPDEVYTIVPEGNVSGRVVIPAGSHLGKIVVKADSAKFLSDPSRLLPDSVIPIRLTDCGELSFIEGRTTTVIGVRYENMLFGNWWHYGKTTVLNADGSVKEVIRYPYEINQSDQKIWTLSTVAPFSLTSNAVGPELNTSSAQMKLTLDGTDIRIEAVDGASYVVEQEGECTFNGARRIQDRMIYLKYRYEKDGLTYSVTDTLQFRNRIRDGVNEWRDENPEHYTE